MTQHKTFTLNELAKLTESTLVGNPDYQIHNVADLESATAHDASFLSNPNYEQMMQRSEAGVIFIDRKTKLVEGRNFLQCDNPSLAFQLLVDHLFQDARELTGFSGHHPSAVIHPTAKIGKDVEIGPFVVVDKNSVIGDRTKILAHVSIGPNCIIGEDCLIHAHVTVRERCTLGNRVIIQPGAVIGSCGFGYAQDKQGRHIKLNQVGTVTIEDDVEIGANACIDRSRFKTTRIKRGTKIDNLVQIAHGVEVGEDNIIVAQTGIAGSSKTGRWVMLGGQVAVAGHLKIGDKVMVAGCSGVSKSLPKAGKYGGIPAIPLTEYNRNAVQLRNIDKFIKYIQDLKNRL